MLRPLRNPTMDLSTWILSYYHPQPTPTPFTEGNQPFLLLTTYPLPVCIIPRKEKKSWLVGLSSHVSLYWLVSSSN